MPSDRQDAPAPEKLVCSANVCGQELWDRRDGVQPSSPRERSFWKGRPALLVS